MLSNAEIVYDQKHPIILPYKHKLTDMIISEAHLKHLYVGVQNLLSLIRLQFWPINEKDVVGDFITMELTMPD